MCEKHSRLLILVNLNLFPFTLLQLLRALQSQADCVEEIRDERDSAKAAVHFLLCVWAHAVQFHGRYFSLPISLPLSPSPYVYKIDI